MVKIFGLVDLSIFMLYDKGPRDPIVDEALGMLESKANEFTQGVE
jgi:hypothetical protein